MRTAGTTEHLLGDEEDRLPGLRLRDLGEQRLEDLERPIRVYQSDIQGLPLRFTPLKARVPPPPAASPELVAVAVILAVAAAATTAFVIALGGTTPEVVPNSVVRLDTST